MPFHADRCCVFREHEKEVQNRKRGKRPRGRPRKHTVTSSCSRRSKLKVSVRLTCWPCLTPHLLTPLWAEERFQGSWAGMSLLQKFSSATRDASKSQSPASPSTHLGSCRAKPPDPVSLSFYTSFLGSRVKLGHCL